MLHTQKALQDITDAFKNWRIFCLIGINDIKKRYIRSKLGQFWITLSLAVNIASLGIVWAYLFKIEVKVYLPYIAFSIIFWTYISTCITEGANVFINATSYLKELSIPKTSYVCSLFIRNLIILGHNLIILIPIYIYCNFNISFLNLILLLCGVILTTIALFPMVLFLGIISLRFRDFSNITASLMQIVFYITPILWKKNLIPQQFHHYLIFNPFAVLLSICRDHFFTTAPSAYYTAVIIYIIFGWIIAFAVFAKFRSRINYWL